MVNIFLEIERLKATLRSRGVEDQFIDDIAHKAEIEISFALKERLDSAKIIKILLSSLMIFALDLMPLLLIQHLGQQTFQTLQCLCWTSSLQEVLSQ